MKITQTTNKEVAQGISVDPSLISLFRSGKRKLPRNSSYVKNMSLFFAARCTAEYQRNALAEMIGPTIIRSAMPADRLALRIEKWLAGDTDMVGSLMESIQTLPPDHPVLIEPAVSCDDEPSYNEDPFSESVFSGFHANSVSNDGETRFFFGEEGRREANRYSQELMMHIKTPCPIFMTMDDSLEWLLTDYYATQELQNNLLCLARKGFTFHQILPAMNHLTRYTESLRFWLPIYSTGQLKAYYYPRLRDDLYRHSTIIVPGRYVQTSLTVGIGSRNHCTLVSSNPDLIREFTALYQEHLALCRPALTVYKKPEESIPLFQDYFSRNGDVIQMVTPLSLATAPASLLDRFTEETDFSGWKHAYQMYKDYVPQFEEMLNKYQFIDLCPLASAEDIRQKKKMAGAGTAPFPRENAPATYTVETYALHLENILRLLEKYENYHFVPIQESSTLDFNLMVNDGGLSILIRNQLPVLMLGITRSEMVQSCKEHLLRIAEKHGYEGMQRTKIKIQLRSLIQELRS